jgi:hypothetical protein
LPNSAASSAPRLIAIRLINQAVDAELVQSLPRHLSKDYLVCAGWSTHRSECPIHRDFPNNLRWPSTLNVVAQAADGTVPGSGQIRWT